jgi:hypothetical protein
LFVPFPARHIFTRVFARASRAKGDALAQGRSPPPPQSPSGEFLDQVKDPHVQVLTSPSEPARGGEYKWIMDTEVKEYNSAGANTEAFVDEDMTRGKGSG